MPPLRARVDRAIIPWGCSMRLLILAFVLAGIGFGQAHAADAYAEAETRYNAYTVDERIKAQVLLTAIGYWNAVPNVSFNRRIFAAVKQYQGDRGWEKTGVLSSEQFGILLEEGLPFLRLWNFKEANHPKTGTSIWVPFGLDLRSERDEFGVKWVARDNSVSLSFKSFDVPLEKAFQLSLDIAAKNNATIHYKILKNDFFVVSSSDHNTGRDSYSRFQKKGSSVVGFTLFWTSAREELHIERVAALVSASLWASATGAVFTEAPSLATEVSAPAATNPAPLPEKEASVSQSTSGSGFFVSTTGLVLTNSHVLEGCLQIKVSTGKQESRSGRVIARDVTNDLALVSTEYKPAQFASFKRSARLGEEVAAFGFPLATVLSSSGNFTLGNITALSGLSDDTRFAQVSTPVQPGNSGGPLLDTSGNVVGVIASKLNALEVMVATKGDIPQNVNFAIKSSVATNFLDTNGVEVIEGTSVKKLSSPDLADFARSITVFMQCN